MIVYSNLSPQDLFTHLLFAKSKLDIGQLVCALQTLCIEARKRDTKQEGKAGHGQIDNY